MGVDGQNIPWRLYPWERDLVPIIQEAGWGPGQSGWVWKILPPPGFDLQTVQPVASCYTNYALLAHSLWSLLMGKETGNLSFLSCGVFINIVS